MGFREILAELAEGMLVGFVEESADQLKEQANVSNINTAARSMGRQLASGAFYEAESPKLVDSACHVQAVQGQLLTSAVEDERRQPTDQAVRKPSAVELHRAWADYLERTGNGPLD